MLTPKNLFYNSLFWGIVAALLLNVIPSIQKVRSEKQLPVDAVLTILLSLGVAINTVNNLYNSSGNIYYTNKKLPGLNREDAESIAKLNNEHNPDGNF